jgi:hypothetical protein
LKEKFVSHLLKAHPTLVKEKLDEFIAPQLISPFQIELPLDILRQAQDFVRACFEMRESPAYLQFHANEIQARGLKDPGNKSICMSYDFHVNDQGQLKLIEINTNAAFLALGYEMYLARGSNLPVPDFSMQEMRECIEKEMALNGKKNSGPFKVAIIDEEPSQQKLFAEFLLFQAYFQEWGWPTEIADYRQVSKADFIYNRFTDFYLGQESSQKLRQQFLDKEICLSPNPYEYLLLADKQRLIEWSSQNFWDQMPDKVQNLKSTIQKNILESRDLNQNISTEIWAERKKYFFKPKRAYGSKQSYRGASISHKAFESVLTEDFIAQEYVPAPERSFSTPEGEQSFKYDLRFYAYGNRVQMALARLYQGQTTNLKSAYGGFTPVIFKQ